LEPVSETPTEPTDYAAISLAFGCSPLRGARPEVGYPAPRTGTDIAGMRAPPQISSGTQRWSPVAATPSPVRLSLPARARNIAVVRRAIEAIADELALPRRLVEDMRLAVTEACTNVVRHAYNDDEADDQNAMRVELRPRPRGMLVVVEDRGRGVQPSPDSAGPGLGLPLIAALTEDLQITHGPDSRGSRVAMSFAPVIEAA
jgi:serine/threonine-protein kinase RsbW